LSIAVCAFGQPTFGEPTVRYERDPGDCPAAPDPATIVVGPLPSDIPVAGRPVKYVSTHYPVCAEGREVPGVVDFTLTIEPDGSVADLQVIQEVPAGFGFAKSGLDALPGWKFEPKLVDGKPVASKAVIRLNWKMALEPPKPR